MESHSLSGQWDLWYGPDNKQAPATPGELSNADWPRIAATVPGNVELDLGRAGLLPTNLEVGNRVYENLKFESCRWWYHRRFTMPPHGAGERVELVFHGLDCLGYVWCNGIFIGTTDNMFIDHRFDLTDHLQSSRDNELFVRIDSAVLAGRRHVHRPLEWAFAGNYESLPVRKAPHAYGWDILPRIVSAGLWRDVTLEVLPPTRWINAYWAVTGVDPRGNSAEILVDWQFTTDRQDLKNMRIRLTLSRHGHLVHERTVPVFSSSGRWQGRLAPVDLWWPRGAGAPALYDAALQLEDNSGNILARRCDRIGLRTVELECTAATTPEKPGEFVFRVNGEKIFMKGTNWVPLDALHSRDKSHLASVFPMVVDLHCNMLRCWGGNVYEDHDFFDLCDQHGILVWQDFAMACAIYPQTDEFAAAIAKEAQTIVCKLRNHPSLALWSGNNECDDARNWCCAGHVDPNTDRISRRVLPNVIQQFDFVRPYLPSSPYRSPEVMATGNNDRHLPEAHLWGPRDDFKGPFYTSSPAHFVSEIGYHGCPNRKSLEQMLDPESVWPWQDNDQWRTKAVRPEPRCTDYDYRIPLMAKQAGLLFGQAPDNLDDFIMASQISQAEALKFFIERWRSGKWRRTGMLWWNLRDGWPVISDAVVDYYNRRKLAYRYIRQSQQDVCGMIQEDIGGRHDLVMINDLLQPVTGQVVVQGLHDGETLLDQPFSLPANAATIVGHLTGATVPEMWKITWQSSSGDGWNHYLAGPRPYVLHQYAAWLARLPLPKEALMGLRTA